MQFSWNIHKSEIFIFIFWIIPDMLTVMGGEAPGQFFLAHE